MSEPDDDAIAHLQRQLDVETPWDRHDRLMRRARREALVALVLSSAGIVLVVFGIGVRLFER